MHALWLVFAEAHVPIEENDGLHEVGFSAEKTQCAPLELQAAASAAAELHALGSHSPAQKDPCVEHDEGPTLPDALFGQ
jgi:hypothetical protein